MIGPVSLLVMLVQLVDHLPSPPTPPKRGRGRPKVHAELTVLVLDNAAEHTATLILERRTAGEHRGLFVLYLPRYAPHVNMVETLRHKLKYDWLTPQDYDTPKGLFYRVWQALAAVGTGVCINFSQFSLS